MTSPQTDKLGQPVPPIPSGQEDPMDFYAWQNSLPAIVGDPDADGEEGSLTGGPDVGALRARVHRTTTEEQP